MTFKTRYRIKSKFRFTLAVTIAILIVAFAADSLFGLDDASSMTREKPPLEVYVSAGDTLWSIAGEYGPDGTDIRKTVNEICILNDISVDELYADQLILVPNYF